jgi:hydroxymethylglutaryl-CoA lyase
MPESIVINDVGPRDGLQNQARMLSVDERLQLIRALRAAGLSHIEVGSFVSPKAVPAMAGTDQIVSALLNGDAAHYTSLIPNMKGYELARAAGANSVTMVLYASEGMAQKNVNMGLQQAEDVTVEILKCARADGIEVVATIAVAFECPFDGYIDPATVEKITDKFLTLGADQVMLADTIGAANPAQVRKLTDSLVSRHGAERLGCHFHDTRAMGVANVFAAVESGIRRFDASIAGLGGCPFAPGASGNVATEDVVMMLEQMGFDTGIDMAGLMAASDLAERLTGTAPGGRSKIWLQRQLEKQAACL